MINSFPDDWSKAEPVQVQSILSIRQALSGEKMEYRAAPHVQNRAGLAEGPLVGGNLKTIETLTGTSSENRISDTGRTAVAGRYSDKEIVIAAAQNALPANVELRRRVEDASRKCTASRAVAADVEIGAHLRSG